MDRKDREKGGLEGSSGKLKVAPSAPTEKGAHSCKSLRLATTFILFVSFSSVAIAAQTDKPLLFGVVPQQSASRLAKMWVPFLARLSEETGLDIKFATMKDIPTFEECLAQGTFDLAYMNPYHYTIYSEKAGYRAFAHQRDKRLQGIIATRIDSPVKTLHDLQNQKIALPSPAAFGASVLPRAEMKSQGIDFEPVYVKSHDSVYRAVVAGFYPAGGGVQRTFDTMPKELKSQLRIIHRTKKYTPHAFAASGNLAPEKVRAILQGMLKIAETAPELLKPIKMAGFEAAADRDWDDVRDLGLSTSQTKIAEQGTVSCRFD